MTAIPGHIRTANSRRKQKAKAMNLPRGPEDITKTLTLTQKHYLSTKKLKQVDMFVESFNSIYYLVESVVDGNCYIYKRIFREGSTNSVKEPLDPKPLTLNDALNEFAEIKNNTSAKWQTVDHNLSKAARFLIKFKTDPKSSFKSFPLHQFSFLMALDEAHINGFEIEVGGTIHKEKSSGKSLQRRKVLSTARRYLTNLFSNPDVPEFNDTHAWGLFLEKIFELVAADVNEEGCISLQTYKNKSDMILTMLKNLLEYESIFGDKVHLIYNLAEKKYDKILSANTYRIENGKEVGTIVPGDHFKPLSKDQLIIFLDQLWTDSPSYFRTAIMGLSNLGRPEELERLLENRFAHIKENNSYDYSSGALVTKTLKKTKISNLTNPTIQIVSRIILFHFNDRYDSRYFSKKTKSGLKSNHHLNDFVPRRLRTTGATYVKHCSSETDAQNRMAHATNTMVNTVYAQHVPDLPPEAYFNWTPILAIPNELNVSEDITEASAYWDLWLLDYFIKKHVSVMKTSEEKREFFNIILKEAREYIRIKTNKASNTKGSVYTI